MNGAGDTVVKFGIQLGQLIRLVKTSLCYVPHGSSLNNITNDKLLDGLVLRNTASTIGTADWIYMATTMFGTSTVSTFAGLKK